MRKLYIENTNKFGNLNDFTLSCNKDITIINTADLPNLYAAMRISDVAKAILTFCHNCNVACCHYGVDEIDYLCKECLFNKNNQTIKNGDYIESIEVKK